MKKRFVGLMLVLGIFIVSAMSFVAPVAAQDNPTPTPTSTTPATPSWLLLEQNGSLYAFEATTRQLVSVFDHATSSYDLVAAYAQWSQDGKYITMVLAGQVSDPTLGDIYVHEFGTNNWQGIYCFDGGTLCTYPSAVNGEWMTYISIVDSQPLGAASLVAYNVTTATSTVLATNVTVEAGEWQGNQYRLGANLYTMPTALATSTPMPSATATGTPNPTATPTVLPTATPNPAQVGPVTACNGETALDTDEGITIRYANNTRYEIGGGANLYGTNPWRNCAASAVTFP